jgi:hypothetical protein
MLFVKQVANDLGLLLPAMEMAAHGGDHLNPIGRAALAQKQRGQSKYPFDFLGAFQQRGQSKYPFDFLGERFQRHFRC